MKLFRTLLFLYIAFGHAPFSAAIPIVLEEHRRGLSLAQTGQLGWFKDSSRTLTLQDIQSPTGAARFVPASGAPVRGTHGDPHWFRVELTQNGTDGDWVLATQTTALKSVHFYGPFDALGRSLEAPVHTGLVHPFATRPLTSERYVLRLRLPDPGTYTVYARLAGDTGTALGLSVWDTSEYLQWRQHKRLFDGVCYGFLLALLVYNLALAGFFRDATYTLYIGQCAFALLSLACFNGHGSHYLWGDFPWWQERAYVVLPSLWLMMGALFARSFLELTQAPRLDLLVRAVALIAAATAVLGLAGMLGLAQAINELVSIAGALLAAFAAIVVLRRGYRPAHWYLAGQLLLFLSIVGVVLVNRNILNSPFLLANGLQIGVAAEMVVFAIALGSRISRLRASQTALRLHAAHLAQAAATDPLTGLANRTGLSQGAEPVLKDGDPHVLMLLDLDQFKPVNDAYGHDAGDAVLCAVAQRLRANVRAGDIVARLGGDEFVLLLVQPLSDAELTVLARRLDGAVREPVGFGTHQLTVGISTGIARSPTDGTTLDELMRSADQAMYWAKQRRSGHAFFHRPAADGSPQQASAASSALPH